MLTDIRIILLNTFHPGNIGAAARAMKTMGLQDLVLVNPISFPNNEATSRAAGAVELLEKASAFDSFEQAIEDCTQVFATSARQTHNFSRPQFSAAESSQWIKNNPNEKIAIVFGGERDGMNSQEINLCQKLLYVPGNPDYDVLNMSAAVQIVCYELHKQFSTSHSKLTPLKDSNGLATQKEINYFYQHLKELLIERDYIRPEQPTDTLQKLRTFLNRAEPASEDIALLRGMVIALTRKNE